MTKTLLLVLPVLFPSWRFFKTIEPSPRVEWCAVAPREHGAPVWQEFHPPAPKLSTLAMLKRLFWNPQRNADLFIVSCAERIQQQPNAHSINVIKRAIQTDVTRKLVEPNTWQLRFRLIFVHRAEADISRELVYLSDTFPASAAKTR